MPEVLATLAEWRRALQLDASIALTPHDINSWPTLGQKEAGNYKKGHFKWNGLDLSIEIAKGGTRTATDGSWSRTLTWAYGYIRGTVGKDGEQVDCYVGPYPLSDTVFVINQARQDGGLDEHKAMLGFRDEPSAIRGYLSNYPVGWKGLHSVRAMSVAEFKDWLKYGNLTVHASDAGGWKGVARICVDFDHTKGRTQYLYSAEHGQAAAAEKFERLKAFDKALPDIRETLATDLNNPNATPVEREAAAVLTLIDRTGFRVGSEADTGGDKQAYGASTLHAEHVAVEGDKVTFTFVGKKGVDVTKEITDRELAQVLGPRVAQGGKLFDISDGQVRDYLKAKAGDFKVKDFRTWNGTSVALSAMGKTKAPTTEKEFKAAQKSVATRVAEHLGNTPTVALQSYIDPAVWGKWRAKLDRKMQASVDIFGALYAALGDMSDFLDSVHFTGTVGDWRALPETGEDPDDEDVPGAD